MKNYNQIKLGGLLACSLLAAGAQAHECRKLGSDVGFGNLDGDMSAGYLICLVFQS